MLDLNASTIQHLLIHENMLLPTLELNKIIMQNVAYLPFQDHAHWKRLHNYIIIPFGNWGKKSFRVRNTVNIKLFINLCFFFS